MFAPSIVFIPHPMNSTITPSIISSSIPASASTAVRASQPVHPQPFTTYPLSPANGVPLLRSTPISMGNGSGKIRGVLAHCREGLDGLEAPSNTAVHEDAVQQPVQQRRRTEHGCFQHTMDMGEHQRTRHVESPFGMPKFSFESHRNSSAATRGLRHLCMSGNTTLTGKVVLPQLS